MVLVWVNIIHISLTSDLNVGFKLRVKLLSGLSSKHIVLTSDSETLDKNEYMFCACACVDKELI